MRPVSALAVLDPDRRPQFVHLLIIDVRLAHEIGEGVGDRVQLALDRLVASSLGVLKHGNQHHDHDRHERRPGSQPRRREPRQDSEREPDHYTSNTTDKERPSTHGMHGCRGHLVESPSLAVDLAWRERPSSALLKFLVLIHEATSTRGVFGSNPEAAGPERVFHSGTPADTRPDWSSPAPHWRCGGGLGRPGSGEERIP
jgi:hypothetical protein